jgi:hypothetical protein
LKIFIVEDAIAQENNELLQLLDAKVQVTRRALNEELGQFRKEQQQRHMQRDFDLYDPGLLKNGTPARQGDDDPRVTVSGIQKFEGEDLELQERKRLQKEQMELWTWQKMRENQAKKQAQLQYDKRREKETLNNNTKIQYLMDMEEYKKRQSAIEDMKFNQQLVCAYYFE